MTGSSRDEVSWLTTVSERTVVGVAAGVGAIVFAAIGGADWLMYDAGVSPFGIMLIGAALAGVLAFGFIYRILNTWYQRKESLRRELQIIGDTNHHIRNALEIIQLSAQTTHDKQVIQQISVAVERIQWVLRELIGEQSAHRYKPKRESDDEEEENRMTG